VDKRIPQTKICTGCKIEKDISEFGKHKKGRFGLSSKCKLCMCKHTKKYRIANLEQRKVAEKKYRVANRAKIKKYRESRQNELKEYRRAHSKKMKVYNKEYSEKHRPGKAIRAEKWRKANPEKIRITKKKYFEKKKKEIGFRLSLNISRGIWQSLKGSKNGEHWELLTGYTLGDLKKHLEKQFTKRMVWSNYGRTGWHIDHIIPINVFNFEKPEHEDFKRCWALKNLQPMWAKENILKSNKLTKHFQPTLAL